MNTNGIWLIDHKATLGDFSPMDLDGSTWILGVCVLNAPDEENANIKFKVFLKSEKMVDRNYDHEFDFNLDIAEIPF